MQPRATSEISRVGSAAQLSWLCAEKKSGKFKSMFLGCFACGNARELAVNAAQISLLKEMPKS